MTTRLEKKTKIKETQHYIGREKSKKEGGRKEGTGRKRK